MIVASAYWFVGRCCHHGGRFLGDQPVSPQHTTNTQKNKIDRGIVCNYPVGGLLYSAVGVCLVNKCLSLRGV